MLLFKQQKKEKFMKNIEKIEPLDRKKYFESEEVREKVDYICKEMNIDKESAEDMVYGDYLSDVKIFNDQLQKANEGDADAQYIVGTFFSSSSCDARHEDIESAIEYYRRGAEQNQPFAALQLCIALRKKDPESAKRYYKIYKAHRTGPKKCEVTYPEFE